MIIHDIIQRLRQQIDMLRIIRHDLQTGILIRFPSVERRQHGHRAPHKQLVEIRETGAINTYYPKLTHPHVFIYEIAEQIILQLQAERRSLSSRDKHFLIRLGHTSRLKSLRHIIVLTNRLKHNTQEVILGLGNAGFGDKRFAFSRIRQGTYPTKQRIRERDRQHLVGIIIVEIDNLHMGTETGHLVGNRALEAHYHTDRDEHHHQSDSDSRQRHTYRRTRRTVARIIGVVKPTSDAIWIR